MFSRGYEILLLHDATTLPGTCTSTCLVVGILILLVFAVLALSLCILSDSLSPTTVLACWLVALLVALEIGGSIPTKEVTF